MKKLVLSAVAALAMMGVTADAGFWMTWRSGSAAAFGLTPTLAPGNGINTAGGGVLLQLIASTDGVQDAVLSDGVGGLVFDGDDVVLDSFVLPAGGTIQNQFAQWGDRSYGEATGGTTPTTPFVAGNYFVRVYTSAAPVADDLYVNSVFAPNGLITDQAPVSPALPPRQAFTPWTSYVDVAGTGLRVGLIPEPMSFAMLLLGAVTIFIRHRRR